MEPVIKRLVFPDKDSWKQYRAKLFTSSRINDLTASGKRKMTESELSEWKKQNPKSKATLIEDESILSDGAISYVLDIMQNTHSEPKPDFYNRQMEWGNETEPQAAIALANNLGIDINSNEFIYTSENGIVFFEHEGKSGGTPDVLLYSLKANAEIKCPDSDTHLQYLLFLNEDNFAESEPKYYDQMQHNMWLTKAEKCYFVSYDPRFKKENLRLFILTIMANPARQSLINRKIKHAHEYMEAMNLKLNSLES